MINPISYYINPQLRDLCQKSIQLEGLNNLLKKHLPENLQSVCLVGNFTRGCLTIVINNSVWTSTLRFYLPTLRDKLRFEGGLYQLASIKISVQTKI